MLRTKYKCEILSLTPGLGNTRMAGLDYTRMATIVAINVISVNHEWPLIVAIAMREKQARYITPIAGASFSSYCVQLDLPQYKLNQASISLGGVKLYG